MAHTTRGEAGWREVPGGIWALGFVSMLMDISSEMIHALLPIYLVTVMGASALTVGIVEGIAEGTASIVKVLSGALSDRLGRRKFLALLGYGLAAVTKPVFPLAASVTWLVVARFVDRVGKGIRAAPRDALVADISPPHLRGASFGLRQSLDSIGAFVGPLVAIGVMWLTADDFILVFWVAVVPAFLALGLLAVAVREPERPVGLRKVRAPLSPVELRRLGSTYWWVVAIATLFSLARFSEAFLILRAQSTGLMLMLVPAVLIVMNVVYAAVSYPAGALSDRMDRTALLLAGLAVLILANLVLAFSSGLLGVAVGIVLWGLHMGVTQGLLATLVADNAPEELRGTGFGLFNLVTGVATLAASVIAGYLWDVSGPAATFIVGAGFATTAAIALAAFRTFAPGKAGAPLAALPPREGSG